MAGFGEIAQIGAHPDAVGVVEGGGSDALRIRVVVVPDFSIAGRYAGRVEGVLGRQPTFPGETVHDDGPVAPMEVVVAVVRVGLDAPEDWKQLGVGPLVVALGGPAVVVLRHAAQEHLAVDGAGAAGDLAAGHHNLRRGVGALAHELPVMVADHDVDFGVVAELHLFGQLLELRIVGARLDQQHVLAVVLGQAAGDNRASGARPNHDVIVLHTSLAPFVTVVASPARSLVRCCGEAAVDSVLPQ